MPVGRPAQGVGALAINSGTPPVGGWLRSQQQSPDALRAGKVANAPGIVPGRGEPGWPPGSPEISESLGTSGVHHSL